MRIIAKSLTASAAITSQACYVLSVSRGAGGCEEATAYHGAAATAGNEVLSCAYEDGAGGGDYCPLPGIYCSDGLYFKIDKGTGVVRYYLAE